VIIGTSSEILLNDMAEMEGLVLGLGLAFDERKTEVGGIGETAVGETNVVGVMNGLEDIDEIGVVSDPD